MAGPGGPQRPGKPRLFKVSRTSFFWSQVIGMLVALGVIVLLIFVSLRWAANQMGIQAQPNQRLLRVVDRLSLEQKKGLWLIEAGDQYLLLATHEQGVTMLERLDSATLKDQVPPKEPAQQGFWERLRGKKAPPATESPAAASTPEAQDPSLAADTTSDPNETAIPTQFEVVSDGKSSSQETP